MKKSCITCSQYDGDRAFCNFWFYKIMDSAKMLLRTEAGLIYKCGEWMDEKEQEEERRIMGRNW